MTLYVVGAIVLGLIGLTVYLLNFGKKAGGSATSAKVAEETVDVLRKAGEAQVNAPDSKPDIVKHLREKGL